MSHTYNCAFNAVYINDYLEFHLPEHHEFKQMALMPKSDLVAVMAEKLAERELGFEHDDGSYDEIMERIVEFFKRSSRLPEMAPADIVDRICFQMVAELRVIVK